MSSSPPSVAATVTALLALTTPFVAPPGCPSFTATSFNTSAVDGVGAVLVADDPSCLPKGWADVVPESRMNFDPAVCPSGWVYHSMAVSYDLFTAFCCDSGYTYLDFEHRGSEIAPEEITNGCGRWTSGLNSDSGSDAPSITDADAASSTLLIHNAWAITWAESDIPNLTPQPPTLTNSMLVPTWIPGEVIPDGKYDRSPSGVDRPKLLPENAGEWFLLVGMPSIVALSIGSCVFCCVRSCCKKKRARRARQAAAAAAAAEGVPDAK
ncbi:hypothetical protein B0I37DRAFT_79822 [Chaetomium sp. MPI-CAGE-AT-0009]|nr:hypothetical protein B0I37DRAFT_79822 [Chaetomium sp. MPI-CAGE-AT-0009]